MKIGVIGIGNIGGTLACKLRAAGHDVRVANSKGPGGVEIADEIGAAAVDTRGAVDGVDAVIIDTRSGCIGACRRVSSTAFREMCRWSTRATTIPACATRRIPEIDAGMVEHSGLEAARTSSED